METRVVVLAVAVLLAATALPTEGAWQQFRYNPAHEARTDVPAGILSATDRFVTTPGPILSGITTAEIDGERIAFYGTYTGINQPGELLATRADGSTLWARAQAVPAPAGYIATPTVRDLNGDGALEVIVASLDDSTVRVHDARTGGVQCSATVGTAGRDLLASSAMVADLDATRPGLEFVIGGSKGNEAGSLMVFDQHCNEVWSAVLDGPAWSSALIQDLDGDDTLEVAITTGLPEAIEILFPNAKSGGQGLFVFEQDGSLHCSHVMAAASMGSPVAADIDNDGGIEIVAADTLSQTRVLNADCSLQVTIPTSGIGTPVLHDIDDDGVIEVIYGDWTTVRAWEVTTTGRSLDYRVSLPWKPSDVDPWVLSSVALGDLDNDGDMDVVAATTPVRVNLESPLESDALPGTVYGIDLANEAILWAYELPNDGAISSPAIDDLDGDGWAEVIIGEGVPLIGDGGALHVIENANPIIRAVASTTPDPMATKPVAFVANVIDGDQSTASLAYLWDFGDGNTSTAHAPSHRFGPDRAGANIVLLTVSDAEHSWQESFVVHLREHREATSSAVAVAEDQPRDPGAAVTLQGTLTNMGSVPDTFRFTSSYQTAWQMSLPGDLTLAPGATADISVPAVVPSSGATPVVSIRATSLGDATVETQIAWTFGGSLRFILDMDGDFSRPYFASNQHPGMHDQPVAGTLVMDQGDEGIANVTVTLQRVQETSTSTVLAILTGGGAGATSPALAVTDDNGVAHFSFTDDASRTPGRHRVTATATYDDTTYTAITYYEIRAPPALADS